MMKKLLSILAVLLAGSVAHAQAIALYQNCHLQNTLGQSIAGAQVYFLTQPANTSALTPLATVYASSAGGSPITQPILTNGNGDCFAYLNTGIYTVVYISPFTGKLVYPDQTITATGGAVLTPTGIPYVTSATSNTVATELQIQNQAGLVVHTNGYINNANAYSPISCVGLSPSAWTSAGCKDATPAITSAITAAKAIGAYVYIDPPPAGMVQFITQIYIGGGEGGLIGGGHHYEIGSVIYQVPGANTDMIRTDPGLSPTSYLDYYLIDGLAFYGDFGYFSTSGKCVNIQTRIGERTQFNRSSCNNWAEDGWFFGQGSDPFFMTDLEGSGDGYNCPGGHFCGGIHFQNPGGDTWDAATLTGWSADNNFTAGVIVENASNYFCSTCGDYFKLLSGKVESRWDNIHQPVGQPIAVLLINTNQTPITIDGLSALSVALGGGGGAPISTAARSGSGTMVITTPTAHPPITVGTNVLVAMNSQSALNGVFTVTASTQTTTTVTASGGALTGTGGNIFADATTDSLVKITGSSANVKINNVTTAAGIDSILGTPFGYYNIINDTVNGFENNITNIPNHTINLGASFVEGSYEYPNFCADTQCRPATSSVLLNPTATQTVVQPSGTQLNVNTFCSGTGAIDAKGCFGAKGNVQVGQFGCTIGVSSSTLTCTSAPFVAADAGKNIYIAGAGTSGASLVANISTFTSSTVVVISTPAITATSNPNIFWATDDTTALQNAYNAAVTQGRALYIPAGYYLHHGLNFTGNTLHIKGDEYGASFLIAMAVTNPGNIHSAQTTGIDISGSAYNSFDSLAVFGGWVNFTDLAPSVNLLAARVGPNGTPFAIGHHFNDDFFLQQGGTSNVFLYGYEQTSFQDCHFEDDGATVAGNVILSAVNTQGYQSPYASFVGTGTSMTKVSFNGARTVFSGSGSQLVLDDGAGEDIYSISVRDAYSNMSTTGAGLIFASGSAAIRSVEVSNVYLEGVPGARFIISVGPAWDWNVTTSEFYSTSTLTGSPLIFSAGILDSNIQFDSTGSSSPELAASSCAGSILHLGQQTPSASCTDYAFFGQVSGGTFNANTGNNYDATGAAGFTGTTVISGCTTTYQQGIMISKSGSC